MGPGSARHVPEGVFHELVEVLRSGVRYAVHVENRYAEVTESSKKTVQRSLVDDGPVEPRAVSLGSYLESFEPKGPLAVHRDADDDLVIASGEGSCHGSTV